MIKNVNLDEDCLMASLEILLGFTLVFLERKLWK